MINYHEQYIVLCIGLLRFIHDNLNCMEYKKYVSVKEAAYILGVSPLTLRNWDKSGKFPAGRHPMNNYRVYKTDDLLQIIDDIESGEARSNARNRIKKLSVKHLDD